ncbi:MAG: response regulator [Flavobacteriales bacterium]|nr:response regulator [Flavobacteriales bacterium]
MMERWRINGRWLIAKGFVIGLLAACERAPSVHREQVDDGLRGIQVIPRNTEARITARAFRLADMPREELKSPHRTELPAKSKALAPPADITAIVKGGGVGAGPFSSVVTKQRLRQRSIPLGLLRRSPVKEPKVREHNPDCFSCFSKNQGLPHDVVHAMQQDRDGNIWFATGAGVSRYDGHAFTHFGEEEGLPATAIWSLLEDGSGRIWFGGYGGGLGFIDGERVTLLSDSLEHLEHGITSMIQDKEGRLWFGLDGGGLAMVSDGTLTVHEFHQAPAAAQVLSLFGHKDGSIWFGTRGNGAARFDGTSFQWHHLPSDTVRSIFSDDEDGLWFCTNNGIVHRKDGRYVHYGGSQGLPSDVIRRGLAAPDGSAWFASHDQGILKLGNGRISQYTEGNGLPTNDIRSLLLDDSGTLWVGTGGDGACRYDGHRFRHFTGSSGLPGPHMKSLLTDGSDALWMGSFENGLIKMERDQLRVFAPGRGLPEAPIVGLAKDLKGRLWCAMGASGVAVIEGADVVQVDTRNGLPSDHVDGLAVDGQGNVWLATRSGVVHITDDSLRTITLAGLPSPQKIRFIHAAPSGRVWFSIHEQGVAVLHDGNWQLIGPSEGLPHRTVTCVLEDPRGWTWIGTHAGLLVLTTKGARHVTSKEGLCSDQVSSIMEDALGNIVYGTRSGMGRILIDAAADTGRWHIENHGFNDGFHGGGVNDGQTMALAGDGTIWIATNTDLTAFTPAALPLGGPPAIRLDGIELFNEQVDWTDLEDQGRDRVTLANGIQLRDVKHTGIAPWSRSPITPAFRHDNNYITFRFTGVSVDRPADIRYRWKLEGLDNGWSAPSVENRAQYGNLAPGGYVFLVEALNGHGLASGTLRYPFSIRPHWSSTWWAYTTYALLSALLVLAYVRWRTASLHERQAALQAEVARATYSMRQQMERAELSEKHKQQFLANMSHEIRTPMNAIMGMAGILKRNPHSREQQSYLDAIATSSENLLVILNDILDISKLEAGRIAFERIPFAPRAVMDNVCEIIRFRAEEKNLALNLHLDPAIPELLLGDPTRLNQIVLNLAGNAVKFTEKGAIDIHVAWRPPRADRSEPGALVVDVRDSGIGIPADRLDRIFEEFTQAYSDTTRKYGGTGLGLTISKRLVEMQGGSITVKSEPGKGSLFTVSIPYEVSAKDPGTPSTPEAGVSARSDGAIAELHDLRILLVEDNAFNAMVAQDELVDAIPGVLVEVAANGRIAVEMARTNTYDVILMDVQMPELNGYDATTAIRALPGDKARTPIVAMTANVLREEIEHCVEAGMDGYIPKPFTRDELMKGILSVMNVRTT